MIWTPASNRVASSKVIFQEYMGNENNKQWSKFLQRYFISPRHSIHIWKTLHNFIASDDLLKKRGIYITSKCHLCGVREETLDHLFVHCSFSKSIWIFLGDCFKRTLDVLGNFETLILNTMKVKSSPQVFNHWYAGIFFICWKCKNEKNFDDKIPSISSSKAWVVASLRNINKVNLTYYMFKY